MANFELDGLEEMMAKLDNMDDRVNRGINTVLKDSAEYLKEGIEINVNKSDVDHLHAREDVIVTGVKSFGASRDNNFVQVGYQTTSWRMWFVEFGTIYQSPQHNVTHAIDETADKVKAEQVRGLKNLIHGG